MKRKFLIMIILLFVNVIIYGQTTLQQLFSASGETFKNTSYQLDWSIGEIQTENYSKTSTILTQGFQQGNYIISAIEQIHGFQFKIEAFPNPTTDFVSLKIEGNKINNLQFTLFDFNDNVLLINNVTNAIQTVNFKNMTSGIYYLNVQFDRKTVKSFKIVKLN